MLDAEVFVINRLGLHARAAAKLVRTAGRFMSRILITADGGSTTANAKSILSVLALAASKGKVLRVSAEGIDEQEALDAVTGLFAAGFDEE